MGQFNGKVAIVTGSDSDIGLGAIHTPIDRDVGALLRGIPLRRMGRLEEVEKPALYLASDAAAYVTGSTYFIDGGLMRSSGAL